MDVPIIQDRMNCISGLKSRGNDSPIEVEYLLSKTPTNRARDHDELEAYLRGRYISVPFSLAGTFSDSILMTKMLSSFALPYCLFIFPT